MSIDPVRVGYVVKRYPRFSETFIVTEILAHEEAGLELDIFSLRPANDSHFQEAIARVRASVRYLYLPAEGLTAEPLTAEALKAADFWMALEEAAKMIPNLWAALESARGEEARDVYQAVLLAREVRLRGIGHLHAHFASSATSVVRLASLFAGIPYSFTAHAKDIFHDSVRPEDLRRKIIDAAAVITVSDFNREYLKRIYGPVRHLYRIYNGLDLDRFPYDPPGERAPRIVAVGRLVEKKGFRDLVEACAILADRKRSFKCQIIGTGPLQEDLRRQIERLNLEEKVRLLGPRPQQQVCQFVGTASVFAAPCVIAGDGNRDGLPTVLLEAMALGTPCVSTKVTGIPEILHNQETGLVVAPNDPEALAAAIEQLLTDSALRLQLAAQARRLIEAQFDIRRNAACLRNIIQAGAGRSHVFQKAT